MNVFPCFFVVLAVKPTKPQQTTTNHNKPQQTTTKNNKQQTTNNKKQTKNKHNLFVTKMAISGALL
jgi:hypothetical protein